MQVCECKCERRSVYQWKKKTKTQINSKEKKLDREHMQANSINRILFTCGDGNNQLMVSMNMSE
jgi:hypothetical protein